MRDDTLENLLEQLGSGDDAAIERAIVMSRVLVQPPVPVKRRSGKENPGPKEDSLERGTCLLDSIP
jgi:hypothetical protein